MRDRTLSEADRSNDAYLRKAPPGGLTEKQRDVLELLIEAKTSKEIARELGISPHTVDQRLMFAREKLGARNRSELAMIYREMVSAPGKSAYGFTGIDAKENAGEGPAGARPRSRIVPEAFDGRHGTLLRIGMTIALAVLLVLVVLGALAIYVQLSRILAR